jgi:hypothetical protein
MVMANNSLTIDDLQYFSNILLTDHENDIDQEEILLFIRESFDILKYLREDDYLKQKCYKCLAVKTLYLSHYLLNLLTITSF